MKQNVTEGIGISDMFDIKENLKKLPDSPGVYIHKDNRGRVIYVGKAISLKNRVRQYFRSPKHMDPKVRAMVSKIAEFEYITTKTEMEALILECNLIKKYMPKYNVLLRDDKTYPYIKMTLNDDYPRLEKTRIVKKDGSRYFGPYANASAVNQMVDLLNGIYGLKRCVTDFKLDEKTYKPCLNYHIHQCQGICRGDVSTEEYIKSVRGVMDFLSGRKKPLVKYLRDKMKKASSELAYEEAAMYRDCISAAEAVLELANSEIARAVRTEAQKEAVAEDLRKKEEAQKEKKMALSRALHEIVFPNILYEGTEYRIEAYDISNTAGADTVGAMVVFEGSKASKKDYRRFKINTATNSDDYGALQEVIYRRFKRGLNGDPGFSKLPDIILVDGGIGQVSVVNKVLSAMKIDIPVLGMAKDDKHRTRALVADGMEIVLKGRRDLYKYIGSIQEEVHRFAIDYHHGVRIRKAQKSVLDGIPGIGPARRNALLEHFKDVENIRKAAIDELSQVPGISRALASDIQKYFN